MHLPIELKHYHLPRSLFLTSCWLIPLVILIGATDLFYFNSIFVNSITLTNYPTLYAPLIAFPHILSSLIIFFSQIRNQQTKMISTQRIAPLVLLGAFFFVFNKMLFELLFLLLLTQHIAGQTFGLMRIIKLPISPNEAETLKFLNYPALLLAFIMIYCVNLKLWLTPYLDGLVIAGWAAMILGTFYSLFLLIKNKASLRGLHVFVFTQVYFLGIYLFSIHTNIFYWGLVFILGHDLIAMLIYQNFYQNKLQSNFKSLLYSIAIPLILSVSIITLALKLRFPYIVFFFQFAHYIAEKYCWKNEFPFRQYLGT